MFYRVLYYSNITISEAAPYEWKLLQHNNQTNKYEYFKLIFLTLFQY
jgi:hypothetical protein